MIAWLACRHDMPKQFGRAHRQTDMQIKCLCLTYVHVHVHALLANSMHTLLVDLNEMEIEYEGNDNRKTKRK